MFRKTLPFVLTIALSALTGSPAVAQQLVTSVRYQDLDLTSSKGVLALKARVRRAADYVCRMSVLSDSLLKHEDPACRRAVLAEADPQISQAIRVADRKAAILLTAR